MAKRYYIIDYIRVFLLLNMVLYHYIWDMVFLFNKNIKIPFYLGTVWQNTICISFIFLSGFCWSFSKNHLKRGLALLGCGLIITAVTGIVMYDSMVIFGILTFLGSAVVLMIFLEKILIYVNDIAGIILSIVIFVLIKDINLGTICFNNIKLSSFLYNGYFMTYLGFMEKGFCSVDFFPILPWIFIFISGYFAYRIFNRKNLLHILIGINIKPIVSISRLSLIVYMVHQPIVYCILYLLYR